MVLNIRPTSTRLPISLLVSCDKYRLKENKKNESETLLHAKWITQMRILSSNNLPYNEKNYYCSVYTTFTVGNLLTRIQTLVAQYF